MNKISGAIKSIQDIMRQDVGVDGDAQRISQLVWMFFLKIFDDREQELELLAEDFSPTIPDKYRWSNWAADEEGVTGDELLEFVNNELFPSLKTLNTSGKNQSRVIVVRNVFEDAYNYMKSGTLMRQIINKINNIDFNSSADRHTFGDIYEQILKDLQSAGNAGEFYTPRVVTQFMVDMIDPKLEETVLDPACGTGGFLTCAIDYKRSKYERSADDRSLTQSTILGIEKKSLPHLLCTTNMILHGIDVPTNIRHDNALTRPLRDYDPSEYVDVIVSNPPFGGNEESGIELNFPDAYRTRETADLFLLTIIHILKSTGRAAVILPDGNLSTVGVQSRIKEKLLAECNLHTVIRLPAGVFNPYTPIKTNILFFEKGQPTENVWFYEVPISDGRKQYTKTRPIKYSEFDDCIKWWSNREEGDRSWKVSIQEIKEAGYTLDFRNPKVADEVIASPAELLEKISSDLIEVSGSAKKILELSRQLGALND